MKNPPPLKKLAPYTNWVRGRIYCTEPDTLLEMISYAIGFTVDGVSTFRSNEKVLQHSLLLRTGEAGFCKVQLGSPFTMLNQDAARSEILYETGQLIPLFEPREWDTIVAAIIQIGRSATGPLGKP